MSKEQYMQDWKRSIARLSQELTLNHNLPPKVDATQWFLGPKGEHEQILRNVIELAITTHVQARRDYQPDDPHFNSMLRTVVNSASQQAESELFSALQRVLAQLRSSVPLASYRNQSHMYWDITLPAIAGYFAAMLYNQNNVAAEASPVTTAIELNVGSDLCAMLGFAKVRHSNNDHGDIVPWGHITCDGSIANAESTWVARNLKFLPISLAAAIRTNPDLHRARGLTTVTCQGKTLRLIDASNWELLNLQVDEVIELPARVASFAHISKEVLVAAIDACSIQTLGLMRVQSQYLDNPAHANLIMCAPATAHYSWPKNAALLGLGVQAVQKIPVDADGRMDITALRDVLDQCLERQWPVIQVVAVMGTTEEGAVDPLTDIIQMRDEYRALGLEFMIHADAAWGGYFASMLRKIDVPTADRAASIDEHPELQLSGHVTRQLHSLQHADTITIDPHKSGFVPYPAGSLCYRNGAHRHLIAYTAPVVDHDDGDYAIGSFGIEGSKPGAAPVSVYLSQAVIPLNERGYGRLLGRCIFNNKRFHAALLCMAEESDLFTVTTLQRTPAERESKSASEIKEELSFIRNEIVRRADNEVLFAFLEKAADQAGDNSEEAIRARRALRIFKAIGSDLSIIAYAFNFRTANGLNRDVRLMNEMNDWLFRQMSLNPADVVKGDIPKAEMIVTASEFRQHPYGDEFMAHFARRAGVEYQSEEPIKFLISTTQNPWLTATSDGSFVDKLVHILKRKANEAANLVIQKYAIAAPSTAP